MCEMCDDDVVNLAEITGLAYPARPTAIQLVDELLKVIDDMAVISAPGPDKTKAWLEAYGHLHAAVDAMRGL